ncbi:spondin-1 [Drosophila tropicalis]|uniref:spondin-1 n=1 Tax=Drosophila tropicalis TaxID=46794 RepID=UPI0035AC1C80
MKAKPKTKLMLLIGLCLSVVNAQPTSSSSSSSSFGYGASFISNPAIYAYTVGNQQQQLKDAAPAAMGDINFATANSNFNSNVNANGNYRFSGTGTDSGSISDTDYGSASLSSNRNYYYTNNNNNNNNNNDVEETDTVSATPTLSTPPAATQPAPLTGCTLDRLAVYKVVLHTYWTRELFPKHYPDWRPTAQWTKTLGRTHNANYALYHIGQPATLGVKQFTETGKTDLLDSIAGEQQQQQMQTQSQSQTQTPTQSQTQSQTQTQGQNQNQGQTSSSRSGKSPPAAERSVFDEFSMPAIQLGSGRSEAKVFVDSNHSLVSLMTRIVPSPDWFIGVDSFELCVGGTWIDTITVELDPLDAGTDNGFTFTAPNWPTAPQGVIYRITSRYPGHPAGSFYYPKSKRLPPIATFQFIKLKEYELSEVFNIAEDDRKYEMVQTQTHLDAEHNHVEMNNELSASIERERQTEQQQQQQQQQQQYNDERQRIRSQLLAKMNPIYNNSQQQAPQVVNVVPKNDKQALMQSIASSYNRRTSNSAATNNINTTLMASNTKISSSSLMGNFSTANSSQQQQQQRRRAQRRQRDCRVSHWSEWTACSKTCGIGEMHRYRKVIKHGKRGGRPCPALQQSKWCGTERNCHGPQSYFNWSDSDT